MERLKIVPIPTAVAETVRSTMKAPLYGFPAHRDLAAGRAPCRHCLKLIWPGAEELILFTHDAFHGQGVAPSPGPVYIHAQPCPLFASNGHLPQAYHDQPLTLEVFGENRARLNEKLLNGTDGDAELQEIFQDTNLKYVQVRSTTAGCYLFRVERAAQAG